MMNQSIHTAHMGICFSEEAIANAVYTLFLTHSFDGVTLHMVADSVDIPFERVMATYASTYQVWYAALCHATEELFLAVNKEGSIDPPLHQLRDVCYAVLQHSVRHPLAHRFIAMPRSENMREPDEPAYGVIALRALLKRLVKQCIKEHNFAPQSSEMITQSVLCLLHGVVDFQLNIQRIPWMENLSDHILETYFAGLAP
ncbi:TetR/AcrR family transcriptional regulator [Tengunoibacter tsumagoiensis]|uniref:Tetracyclin repressor-like C-terminal domain-containing protein n=1 Tax=Tengunoibacter tsumagoiensis TaxID=2014871 RepID=A0A402A713_9CHLR|nr:hypothetical protein [Tengunoibacter tsumagoiensis]GCE14924.1 hypothetical protein KTT_47830 [Tengunoibacter tsumagoiensis]